MVAGSSGSGGGSVAAVDTEGPRLEQAPKSIDNAATTARLPVVRAHPKLTIVFPRIGSCWQRYTSKPKTAVGATTNSRPYDLLSLNNMSIAIKKGLTPVCLTGSAPSHIPGAPLALREHDCQRCGMVRGSHVKTARLPEALSIQPDLQASCKGKMLWLNPDSARCMTESWSSASMPRKSPRAGSSFPTPPRKSPRRAKSSRWVRADATNP